MVTITQYGNHFTVEGSNVSSVMAYLKGKSTDRLVNILYNNSDKTCIGIFRTG